MEPQQRFGVVVLLGAPGVGKSLLGKALSQAHGSAAEFLNVGEELRAQGLVKQHQEHPTEATRQALASKAEELRAAACRRLAAEAASGNSRCAAPGAAPAASRSALGNALHCLLCWAWLLLLLDVATIATAIAMQVQPTWGRGVHRCLTAAHAEG